MGSQRRKNAGEEDSFGDDRQEDLCIIIRVDYRPQPQNDHRLVIYPPADFVQPLRGRPGSEQVLAIRKHIDAFIQAGNPHRVDSLFAPPIFDQLRVAAPDIAQDVGELTGCENNVVSSQQLAMKMPMSLGDGTPPPSAGQNRCRSSYLGLTDSVTRCSSSTHVEIGFCLGVEVTQIRPANGRGQISPSLAK